MSSLEDSVLKGDYSTFLRLLSRNSLDKQSMLIKAAHEGQNDMVRALVAMGVDINGYHLDVDVKKRFKYTALHAAVWGEKETTVQLLFDLGADWSLKGNWQSYSGTPLAWAEQQPHKRLWGAVLKNSIEVILENHIASQMKREIAKMKRSLMKSDLAESLEITDKVQAKLKIARELDTKLNELSREIKRLETETKETKEIMEKVATDVKQVVNMSNLRTKSGIERLRHQLQEVEGKNRDKEEEEKDAKEEVGVSDNDKSCCPVCTMAAEKVFSCSACDNWVCGTCKEQLINCPSCREDLKANPMKRNIAVERLLAKI